MYIFSCRNADACHISNRVETNTGAVKKAQPDCLGCLRGILLPHDIGNLY